MNKLWNVSLYFSSLIILYHKVQSGKIPVRIVNGTEAKEGEFPYLVQIRDNFKYFQCGGSILADKWILTAGHCVRGAKLDTIVYGTTILFDQRNPPNGSIKIERTFLHPQYTTINTNRGAIPIYDVGILELAEPIPFDAKAQPIKLADAGEVIPFHTNGVLAGWGENRIIAYPTAHLQKIQLQILTDEECKKRIDDYGEAAFFNATHDLCSDDYWNGECYGESGSPFVINGSQYGIVSWSLKPCGSNPGTYSRITTPDYRQFIKNTTGI